MKVPFVDLQAQLVPIRQEVDQAIQSVLDKCNFILGDDVQKFENEFAHYCGTQFAIGVASGLDAIHLALRALGIGPGDEVITQANSFIATALGISQAGAKPVFVDVESDTLLPSVEAIASAITPKTKAIMPVHLYGRIFAWQPLQELAESRGLTIIEDAAQAHGAKLGNKRAGTLGKIACFSFYPGKNLGCYGDGGAIVTDDIGLKEKIEALRNYGSNKKYHHPIQGFNSRLDTLQAAILRVKLPHLDSYNDRRYQAASLYNQHLFGKGDLQLPLIPEPGAHTFHLYVVRTARRDELIQYLANNGIACGIHYPTPIHLHGAYKELGYKNGDFPNAEAAAKTMISLPIYPEITKAQIEYVAQAITKFFSE